ncbi:MAG TPA: hypothetical protein VFQ35_24620, partial [Polyangiaceae bacterium]|nr:hypothetical protein [Polyangiaceae bacterium]
PEQARGEKVDARCDIYALGVLCYQMMTGQLPFDAETTVAILMAHLIQSAEKPSEIVPELSPEFDAPLLRMLEKDPAKRPSSAGAAIAEIRSAAERAGLSVLPGPPKLARPEPETSGEFPAEIESTLLASPPTPGGSSRGAERRKFLLFGAGALFVGATFTWLFAHASHPSDARAPVATPEARLSSTLVSAPAPPVSATASAAPAIVEAPSAAPSASAPSKRVRPVTNVERGKKATSEAPASATPHDLESPFGP